MQIRLPWLLSRKRLGFAVIVDTVLFVLVYSGAFQLRFGRWPAPSVAVTGLLPRLIQSPSQASLLVLSAWADVGGIAPSLCLKAPPLQPIST